MRSPVPLAARPAALTAIGLALVVATPGPLLGQAPGEASVQATRPSPEATIDHFLSLPHGLYRLSPEDRRTLAAMKAHPAPYVAALRHRAPTVAAAVVSDADLQQLAFVGAILGALGTPQATDLLARWCIAADRVTARAERPGDTTPLATRRRALGLYASLLDSLGTTAKPSLVAYLLGRLVAMNPGPRTSALEYLARSSARDPVVRARLEALIVAPDAPLHGDPAARAILAHMPKP